MVKLTQSYISSAARELGMSPTKKLGQNFMIDDGIARKIVKLANVSPDSNVLEVGTGFGSLTQYLVNAGKNYLGIEYDRKLFNWIISEYKSDNINFLHKDALKLEKADFQNKPFDILVANLPYNISTPLLITYFKQFENLKSATVLVQKEVADRILASPGGTLYGIPTVKLKLLTNVKKLLSVPPGVFWPRPKVDSTLINLTRKNADEDAKKLTDTDFLFKIIDAAFSHRRKTLVSSLTLGLKTSSTLKSETDKELNLDKSHIQQSLEKIGLPANVRAEELNSDQFIELSNIILSNTD